MDAMEPFKIMSNLSGSDPNGIVRKQAFAHAMRRTLQNCEGGCWLGST